MSVIDVSYDNKASLDFEHDLDNDVAKLPPPIQFQQVGQSSELHHHSRHSSTSQSSMKHENEDFRSSHEINLESDAISITTHHNQAASPDQANLTEYFKKLDRINKELEEQQSGKFNFSEMNRNFLDTSDEGAVVKNPNFNDLVEEIQNFSSVRLKHVKNVDEDRVSIILPAPPIPRTPSPIIRKKISDEDRASIASSINKNSAHLY